MQLEEYLCCSIVGAFSQICFHPQQGFRFPVDPICVLCCLDQVAALLAPTPVLFVGMPKTLSVFGNRLPPFTMTCFVALQDIAEDLIWTDGQLEAAFCLGFAYENMHNPVASMHFYEDCQQLAVSGRKHHEAEEAAKSLVTVYTQQARRCEGNGQVRPSCQAACWHAAHACWHAACLPTGFTLPGYSNMSKLKFCR